jgi:excisionase family DNA binding protein
MRGVVNGMEQRFLLLSDVAEILNISASQAYALVRNEELRAIKIGGRGQWRIERSQLEAYIDKAYTETRAFIRANPLGRAEPVPSD